MFYPHILMTTRRLTGQGLTEKTRELDDKTTGPLEIEAMREHWAYLLHEAGFTLEHRAAARLPVPAMPSLAPRPLPSYRPLSLADPRPW